MVGHFMRQGKRFVPVGCSSVGDRNKDSSLQPPFYGLARRNRDGEGRNESVRHLEAFLSVRQDIDAFGQILQFTQRAFPADEDALQVVNGVLGVAIGQDFFNAGVIHHLYFACGRYAFASCRDDGCSCFECCHKSCFRHGGYIFIGT